MRDMKTLAALSGAIAVLAGAPAARSEIVYFNDFETAVGPGWSDATGNALGINRTPTGRGFLGWEGTPGPLNGVSHETLTLTTAIPKPGLVAVDFDLYLINSWDGNDSTFGPDIFQFFVESDRPALQTTFANVTGLTQSYPDSFGGPGPTANHPAKTGASEVNTLGYLPFTVSGDAVYHLSFRAPVTDGDLEFSVRDISNGAGLADESWGLDNVRVSTVPVPEPGTLSLLSSALIIMGWACRYRRRMGAS
jgi:hypothetical protein